MTAFVTGYGQSDTHALTLNDGTPNPHKSAGTPYATVTGKEIAGLVKDPPSVAKEDAQWFIPSTYAEHDARSHETQRANGSFQCLTLDVDKNDLSLDDVQSVLGDILGDASRVIHSSRSSKETDRKWRAIIFLKDPIAGDQFSDVQNALFDVLEEASGGVLIPDRALSRPAQLVFLPNKGEFYQHVIHKGDLLDLTPDHPIMLHKAKIADDRAKAAQEAKDARERRAAHRRANAPQGDGVSPVDAFNDTHAVADLLDRYGYTQAGSSNDWRSPFQSSGSYATRDYGDYCVSLSDSDDAADIGAKTANGHRYFDAFDLFVHFEHGRDFKKAVAAYGAEIRPARLPADSDLQNLDASGAWIRPNHTAPGFRFTLAGDLEYREPEFLIDNLIETDTLGMIFGDPGCGKSFVAVDIALSVASGEPFHGNAVKQGSVFMIAGEGHNGLARRFHAWSKDRGVQLEGVPLFKSERAAQFLDAESAKAVAQAVDELAQQHGTPTLIIIDTVARNFGAGDENSTSDMSNFIAAIDDLKARYHGCAILLVHHSGHADKQRARGAMALKGALDCEFRVQKDGDTMQLVNTKMKDAEPPEDQFFLLHSVALTGEAKSAVLRKTEGREKERRLTVMQKLALDTYTTAGVESGVWDSGAFRGVHLEDWRAAFYEKHTGETTDTKRKAFNRVRADLASAGHVKVQDDVYLATDPAVTMPIMWSENPQRDMRDKAGHTEKCHGAEAGYSGTSGTCA